MGLPVNGSASATSWLPMFCTVTLTWIGWSIRVVLTFRALTTRSGARSGGCGVSVGVAVNVGVGVGVFVLACGGVGVGVAVSDAVAVVVAVGVGEGVDVGVGAGEQSGNVGAVVGVPKVAIAANWYFTVTCPLSVFDMDGTPPDTSRRHTSAPTISWPPIGDGTLT